MKITSNWLKEYVDFDWSPEELGEELTMLGLEVESIEHQTDPYAGIVVAEVQTREQHPNADKLSVCQVNDGEGVRQIVCGATNFKPGDKVPLILPGSTLPSKEEGEKPFVIKVGKLRGVESQGMMCSGQELGLSSDAAGLMILDQATKVGTPLSEHLGRSSGDVIFDLEITPNRPDWNSVLGIAREIAAKTGATLKIPETPITEDAAQQTADSVDVRIDNEQLCPRYTARIIKGVKVGPSPTWLSKKLEAIGIRSINNVVDVTNFVMMETGQPLHAFDLNLLQPIAGKDKPCIVVRAAADKEKFTTLDEQERELDSQMAVIADETRAIALAGVMGGLNSEISEETSDVLIESAAFHPGATRRTSKVLGLRTDASYRFERGTDWEMVEYASRRTAALIQETAGGQLMTGMVDAAPALPEKSEVSLRYEKTNSLLGESIPDETQALYLTRLGLTSVSEDKSSRSATFGIPSNRSDIKREVDLIEEVIRLHGINNVTSTPPRGTVGENSFNQIHDELATMRQTLASMGLSEAQGQTLIAGHKAAGFTEKPVALEYPLSSDMDVMRPSIIPGLIDSLSHNANHKATSVGLFEIGRTFSHAGEGEDSGLSESRKLGVAITGNARSLFWGDSDSDKAFDFYDIKGIFEEFMEREGLPAYQISRCESPSDVWVESAEIRLGKNRLGIIGQLHPVLQKKENIRHPAFIFELDLDLMIRFRRKNFKFKELPQYPSTSRDIAMLLKEEISHEQVLQCVKKAKVKFLDSTDLFDVFRGKNVPDGYKSMAYSFTYRSPDKTLTDKEVQKAHDALVNALTAKLEAQIR